MSVKELVWCGQVIEASCSRYGKTACIPLIARMHRACVCACTLHTECLHAQCTHLRVSAACGGGGGHGGLQNEACWKGFPACAFHWGTPNMLPVGRSVSLTSKHLGAALYSNTVKTTGSSVFILTTSGRQWVPLGSLARGYKMKVFLCMCRRFSRKYSLSLHKGISAAFPNS